MKDIIVEIKNGAVISVYGNAKDTRVIVVDRDSAAEGSDAASVYRQSSLNRLPKDIKKEYRQVA